MFKGFMMAAAIVLAVGPGRARAQDNFLSSLSGEVVVRSIDESTLMVAVDSSDQEGAADGIADATFLYSSKTLPRDFVSLRFPFANVEYKSEAGLLRVTSPEQGNLLRLQVDPAARVPRKSPQDKAAAESPASWQIFDGRGLALSVHRGGAGVAMDAVAVGLGLPEAGFDKSTPVISYDDLGSPGSPGGCQSGGRGASICNRGCNGESCSVTCTEAGFYACCRCSSGIPACNCVSYTFSN
jgi:hypothetical protein